MAIDGLTREGVSSRTVRRMTGQEWTHDGLPVVYRSYPAGGWILKVDDDTWQLRDDDTGVKFDVDSDAVDALAIDAGYLPRATAEDMAEALDMMPELSAALERIAERLPSVDRGRLLAYLDQSHRSLSDYPAKEYGTAMRAIVDALTLLDNATR